MSARLNDNENIGDRLDHDRLAPMTSEQEVNLSPAIHRGHSHELVALALKQVNSESAQALSNGVLTGMPFVAKQNAPEELPGAFENASTQKGQVADHIVSRQSLQAITPPKTIIEQRGTPINEKVSLDYGAKKSRDNSPQ